MEDCTVFSAPTSIRAHSGITPSATDSMVTVRLSDDRTHPASGHHSRKLRARTDSATSTSSSTSSSSNAELLRPISASLDVDWEGLERTEEQEPRDEGTDESTALLLARLEQENAALAGNPKFGLSGAARQRSNTRPPSIQHLQKLVNDPNQQSFRISQLPTPPMTELEFWAALVSDYPQTAQRLPTLTSNKIRGGVPPPLRGVVWPSIAGARDCSLHEEFQRLCGETSPYEGIIGKDVSRSFPNVELFREKDGEGQLMLGRVLKCFSLYDEKIGYCQGLGFVVGPLLMHMSDADAFCVLVRLMEHYDLRSCYLPDLSGLHLRIFQFQSLLKQHLPELAIHLESMNIEPLYVSQWFLSFFAVTCPLPMLLRIYDVLLSEGATETLMRVALSLMKRNMKKIMACTEFEDAMQLLLSRVLWDTYAQHADDLVTDFVSLTGLVSREALQTLEDDFKDSQGLTVQPSLKKAASQFMGRFWAGSAHSSAKSGNNLSLALPSRPMSSITRTPSKQSLASTLNSHESTSDASTVASDTMSMLPRKSDPVLLEITPVDKSMTNSHDRGLHNQIEDLLTALSDMQRDQANLSRELQREREEREEERGTSKALLAQLKAHAEDVRELAGGTATEEERMMQDLIAKASQQFLTGDSKRVSILQTKHQLRDAVTEWKEKHDTESSRCQDLMKQLDEREQEQNSLRDQLKDARNRIQDGYRDKQRMERTIQELRGRISPLPESPVEATISPISENSEHRMSMARPGLRGFKLGRPDSTRMPSFSRRSSSLNIHNVIAMESQQSVNEDALLLELVSAKTAEALARQELEEVKGKLESLKKLVGVTGVSPSPRNPPLDNSAVVSSPSPLATPNEATKSSFASSTGGFFSGWGKRTH